MSDNYEDIIELPYIKSTAYAHMSVRDRAAQFAPFSALVGYSDTVSEIERLTTERITLDEYEINDINRGLQYILENISKTPVVTVTYFIPDQRKSGGEYRTLTDKVERLDDHKNNLELSSGEIISFEQIIALQTEKDGEDNLEF